MCETLSSLPLRSGSWVVRPSGTTLALSSLSPRLDSSDFARSREQSSKRGGEEHELFWKDEFPKQQGGGLSSPRHPPRSYPQVHPGGWKAPAPVVVRTLRRSSRRDELPKAVQGIVPEGRTTQGQGKNKDTPTLWGRGVVRGRVQGPRREGSVVRGDRACRGSRGLGGDLDDLGHKLDARCNPGLIEDFGPDTGLIGEVAAGDLVLGLLLI